MTPMTQLYTLCDILQSYNGCLFISSHVFVRFYGLVFHMISIIFPQSNLQMWNALSTQVEQINRAFCVITLVWMFPCFWMYWTVNFTVFSVYRQWIQDIELYYIYIYIYTAYYIYFDCHSVMCYTFSFHFRMSFVRFIYYAQILIYFYFKIVAKPSYFICKLICLYRIPYIVIQTSILIKIKNQSKK